MEEEMSEKEKEREKEKKPEKRCIICGSTDIKNKEVDEFFSFDRDIVVVSVKTKVCGTCGERYHDKRTLKKLQEIEDKVKGGEIKELEVVGKVLRVKE
jgi:YgiT-type zinc finger domain-containing protein